MPWQTDLSLHRMQHIQRVHRVPGNICGQGGMGRGAMNGNNNWIHKIGMMDPIGMVIHVQIPLENWIILKFLKHI